MSDALPGELEALRAFADAILKNWPHGDVDCFDLQETAVKYGLLVETTVSERCNEECDCAAYGADFPTTCYRRARPGATKTALHGLRVHFAEVMLQEFPVFGSDVLNMLANVGLCTKEELQAAIGDAEIRIAQQQIEYTPPLELTGEPITLREFDV